MPNQIIVASKIQTMCMNIINYISLMQTIASVTDILGHITDLYDNSGNTVAILNSIGKQIESNRISGYLDVITTGANIVLNVMMPCNVNFASTTKIKIGSVNLTNFYTIVNELTTGAVFNINYVSSTSSVLYPSPYSNGTYSANLSALLIEFKNVSNNLNVFLGKSNQTSSGVLTSSQGLAVAGGTLLESATVTQNLTVDGSETILGNLNVDGNFNFGGDASVSNGIINEAQVITDDLTLSSTSGISGKNSYAIGVDTTSGVVTVTLPNDSAKINGRTYYIFDVGGNASINNIIINGNGLNISRFGTSVNINADYNSLTLIYISAKTMWFII